MYAQITAPGSKSAIATAGPTLYAPGNALVFSSVRNGHGLVVNAQLRDAPGDSATIVAYGLSAPFNLEPNSTVNATVAVELHPVVALPSSVGAIQVLDAGGNVLPPAVDGSIEVGSTTVSLLLTAGTGAIGARLSNLPSLPEGSAATIDVPTLMPATSAQAPSGFQSFRYDNWNLDAGLQQPCAAETICQRKLFVFFTDANGVPSATASATLFVNLLTPSLIAPAASPAVAGIGETISIIATPNEQLAATPIVHVYVSTDATMANDLSTSIPFVYHLESTYTFTHQVAAADPNGSYFVTFTLTDLAGNVATYGTQPNERIPFFINSSVPVVTLGTIGPSPSRAGATITIPFTLDQPLPLTSLTVRLANHDVSGSCLSADNIAWSCSYVPQVATDTEGAQPILVTATGSAGNVGTARGFVTFDFMPPSIVVNPVVSYQAQQDNVLGALGITPTAATVGTVVDVAFTVSELLATSPEVVSNPAGLTFQQTVPAVTASAPAATSFIFDAVLAPGGMPPDGATGLLFTLTDLAGNMAIVAGPGAGTAPSINITTVAPPAPSTAAGGPITYTRTPWGSSATGGVPSYALAGNAGAGQAGSLLVVYGSPSTASDVIGSGLVRADGSFGPLSLVPTDRPAIYVTAVDGAGNQSPAVAAHNVIWTAAFNGKIPGSTAANPHSLLCEAADPLGVTSLGAAAGQSNYGGALLPEPARAAEPPSYAGLFSASTAPDVTTFRGASWVASPTAGPPGRSQPAMAYDSSRGVAVLFGGKINGTAVNETWEWDGEVWTQKTPAVSPPARFGHAMAYDSFRGVTVLFGGAAGTEADDTWEWDGTTWTELFPATRPPARDGQVMAYDSLRGVTLLFGGESSGTDLSDTWQWDGSNWTDLDPANNPPARAGATLAFDAARGVAVLFGGEQQTAASTFVPLNDTWEWHGTNWIDRSPATGPAARAQQAMAYDAARGATVLFGGTTDHGTTLLNDTWQWNGSAWMQPSPAVVPPARSEAALIYDSARGVSVLTGGDSLNDTWAWNGSTWLSRLSPANPPARQFPAMDFDAARGVGVLFAGASGAILGDTWEWNGTSWAQQTPSLSPPARYLHALAYDSVRGVSVLFGGASNAPLNDTWEWNGTGWREASPAVSPSARTQHALAFDAARGVTVLFGGTGQGDLNDTWAWDGTGWTQQFPAASPPARWGHAMAYDSARGVTVLFGGSTDIPDTWLWNGTNWTQVFPATNPPGRIQHALAYDSTRGVTVLFGGCCDSNGAPLNDTWEWNGTTWAQTAPAISPGGRQSFALAYDSWRGEALLFGGLSVSDTWLLPGAAASRPADLLRFRFDATGETSPAPTIGQVALRATAGGTGSLNPRSLSAGAPVPGAVLASWDVSNGGSWRGLVSNAADSSAPLAMSSTSTSAWSASRDLAEGSRTLDFAVFPVASTGNGAAPGAVALEAPELTVQYQHSESPCTPDSSSSCFCAADETVCGLEGSPLCSDTSADPRNCGGCADADAGVVCGGGMWCINGACACPGSEMLCEGACTDPSLDPANCGHCGNACGAYRSCVGGTCSPCAAGQALVGSSCVPDLAIRSSLNQDNAGGTAQLTVPSTVQPGDKLIVITAPADSGAFTAAVSSGSGGSWNLVGLGNDAGQFLAIFEKTAQAADANQPLTVTMKGLVTGTGESLHATLVDVFSRSGASIAVDGSAFGGSVAAGVALDAGITTTGLAPAVTATGPSGLVLVAAAQAGSTGATLPAGVTMLTGSGGLTTGSSAVALPGPVPVVQLAGGSSTATWEIAQVVLSSGAR
jgi:hypothetical protein